MKSIVCLISFIFLASCTPKIKSELKANQLSSETDYLTLSLQTQKIWDIECTAEEVARYFNAKSKNVDPIIGGELDLRFLSFYDSYLRLDLERRKIHSYRPDLPVNPKDKIYFGENDLSCKHNNCLETFVLESDSHKLFSYTCLEGKIRHFTLPLFGPDKVKSVVSGIFDRFDGNQSWLIAASPKELGDSAIFAFRPAKNEIGIFMFNNTNEKQPLAIVSFYHEDFLGYGLSEFLARNRSKVAK